VKGDPGRTSFTFVIAVFALWLTQRIKRRQQLAISWTGTLCANVWLVIASALYAKSQSAAAGIAAVVAVWMYSEFPGFIPLCVMGNA
jgi:SP family sugar:H+ symporter-like MFS transporter